MGSRGFKSLEKVGKRLSLLAYKPVIISGGARGVDTEAIRAAKELGFETKVFPAEWDRYGKSAGMIRNNLMLAYAQKVLIFWDGKSPGTKHMIEATRKRGRDYEIIRE